MIALQDDFNQNEVSKKKVTIQTNGKMQTLLQRLIHYHKKRKQRRSDRLALYRLVQLDDALLKDIGITRSEINAVRGGTLSMDALIKHDITTTRDNTGLCQPKKGIPSK